MSTNESKRMHGTLGMALAGMLALGLAACGEKSPPANASQESGMTHQPAAQPAAVPEKKSGPAQGAASGVTSEAGKDAAGRNAAGAGKAANDAALADKVKSALYADPDLKMLSIDVGAANGAITLYGNADTLADRDKAGRVASGVAGVRSVDNRLVIAAGS